MHTCSIAPWSRLPAPQGSKQKAKWQDDCKHPVGKAPWWNKLQCLSVFPFRNAELINKPLRSTLRFVSLHGYCKFNLEITSVLMNFWHYCFLKKKNLLVYPLVLKFRTDNYSVPVMTKQHNIIWRHFHVLFTSCTFDQPSRFLPLVGHSLIQLDYCTTQLKWAVGIYNKVHWTSKWKKENPITNSMS